MTKANTRPSVRALKALKVGETSKTEYKSDANGLSVDDLCSFANSKHGGTILLGVREARGKESSFQGIVVGCPIDDSTQLIILNKAQSCHPPIAIDLHVEYFEEKTFLRIEIAISNSAPHCTPKGTYLVRSGTRNTALLPPALLKSFLDREGREFKTRFSSVTRDIESKIETLQSDIRRRINNISQELGWSDMMFDDTGDRIDSLISSVNEMKRRVDDSSERTREIIRTINGKDPVKDRAIDLIRKLLKAEILNNFDSIKNRGTSEELSIKLSVDLAKEVSQEEMNQIFTEVYNETLASAKTG